MLAHVLVAAALAASPRIDPQLVGTWIAKDVEVATLNADGTGHMQEEAIRWSAKRGRVRVVDLEGKGGEAPYRLDGDVLTVVIRGTAYQLKRAAAAEPDKAAPPKAGAPGARPATGKGPRKGKAAPSRSP